MRIIDKNNDYYDYLQVRDDDIVFDRRGSIPLSKTDILECIDRRDFRFHEPFISLLLQCGATYWLLLAEGKDKKTINYEDKFTDYNIEVLTSWKDYDKPLEVLRLQWISIGHIWYYDYYDVSYKNRNIVKTLDRDKLARETPKFKDAIIQKDYDVVHTFGKDKILLLKSVGIPLIISPDEIYNAIDECFSLMKTGAESTVAEGTTNNDKIKNHGFDTKTSFRGK